MGHYLRRQDKKKPDGNNSSSFFKPAVQKKLKVGKSDDAFEKEADAVADQVVANGNKQDNVQKKGEDEEVQQKPLAAGITPLVQKQATEEEPVQTKGEEEEVQKQEEEEAVQAKGEEEEVQKQEEEEAVQAKGEEEEVQKQEEEEAVQAKGEEEEVQKQEEEEAVQAKGEEEEVQKLEEEEAVQTKEVNSPTTASAKPGVEQRINQSKGKGHKMDDATKERMEKGFGADFDHVNIHTDEEAQQLSSDLGAQAFTHGNDIYFNQDKYNPSSSEGQHLLAHELTHTIQQKGMVQKKVQRKDLSSHRFKGNHRLEQILDRIIVAKKGRKGAHIRILQQALIDAGYKLPKYGVDGIFGNETKKAVKAFQNDRTISEDGVIGHRTMEELDKKYSGYKTEHDQFAGDTKADVLGGSRDITEDEKKSVAEAMSTETKKDPKTGKDPVFDPANSAAYKKEIRDLTESIALRQYNKYGKGKAALRAHSKNLHAPKDINSLAKESKNQTDKVYGNLKKGKPLEFGKNIKDGWAHKQSQITGKSAAEVHAIKSGWAEWRIQKIVQGPSMKEINKKYGAIQDRAQESVLVQQVITELSTIHFDKLVQTHLGWPGFASGGKIYLQRFKSSDNDKNRQYMWKNFGTIIHEYIHTLEARKAINYRSTIPEKKGGKTLREGVTDYFTKIVWHNVDFGNHDVRKRVEGPFYDDTKNDIPKNSYYDEARNAERIAGIIGVNNLMAYFFLGEVKYIKGT